MVLRTTVSMINKIKYGFKCCGPTRQNTIQYGKTNFSSKSKELNKRNNQKERNKKDEINRIYAVDGKHITGTMTHDFRSA